MQEGTEKVHRRNLYLSRSCRTTGSTEAFDMSKSPVRTDINTSRSDIVLGTTDTRFQKPLQQRLL